MRLRLNLLTKLLGAFGLVALILGSVTFYVLGSLNGVDTTYGDVALRVQPASTVAASIQTHVFHKGMAIRGYLLLRSEAMEKDFQAADKELTDLVQSLLKLTQDPAQVAEARNLERLNKEYNVPAARAFALAREGKVDEANQVLGAQALPLLTQMVETAAKLSTDLERQAAGAAAAAHEEAVTARNMGYGALGAGALLAMLLAVWIAGSMSAQVRKVAALAGELANGNLAVEKLNDRGQDEVGDLARAFNRMVASLQQVVRGVHQSTRRVTEAAEMLGEVSNQAAQASTQTANAVQTVAGGASRQAENTADVMAIVGQLRDAISQVAEGSQQSSQEVQRAVETLARMVADVERISGGAEQNAAAALQASRAATEGAGAVGETVSGMARIRHAVDLSADRVRTLAELSGKVGVITGAISGIADQTNLLALNAAIEAARAGEHGRGFAVVAEEVRKLAEHASRSAREITDLVAAIQRGTAEVVAAMEGGRGEVEAGSKLAAAAGATLQQIQSATEQTAREIQQIAAAAKATVEGAREVARVFDTIAAVTEENTASAEEMAASSAEVIDSVEGIASIARENAAVAEEVSASTEEVTASAQEVAGSAEQLQGIARDLQDQVAVFRL